MILVGLSLPAYAQAPALAFNKVIAGSSLQSANHVGVDASGNVWISGYFHGTADFGGGTRTSAGGRDVFIAKYDAAGNHLFSGSYGDASDQTAGGGAVDANGDYVICGDFFGTVNFGSGNLVSQGGTDMFLAKFAPNGAPLWSFRYGNAGLNQSATKVTTDASRNIYMTGQFDGTVNFGGLNHVAVGGQDTYVAEFFPTGGFITSQKYGDAGTQLAGAIAVDASGSVFIAGNNYGTVNFGGGNIVSAGAADVFLAKFGLNLVHTWSAGFGDVLDQGANSLALDPIGNICMGGYMYGSVNFGTGLLTSAGLADAYVAKFNTSGVAQWSKRFGDAADQLSLAVATDAASNVFLGGVIDGSANFGGGSLTSAGGEDIFIAKFNSAGVHQWSTRHGDAFTFQRPWFFSMGPGNRLHLAGQLLGTASFGVGLLNATPAQRALLVKFGNQVPHPTAPLVSDIGNDQGKQVRVEFSASGYDLPDMATWIEDYEVYRRQDPLPVAPPEGATRRQLLDANWDFVGSTPAHAVAQYQVVVPTLADSTVANGLHLTTFFVRASTPFPALYFDSQTGAGYSLDNLAPGAPTGLLLLASDLEWDESTAVDFDYFTVYGSNTNLFASAVLIDYTAATSLDVSASLYPYYFVTATDFSGNEGNAASLDAGTDVDPTPKNYVLSISSYPNPFNPSTTIRYTVPSKGRVEVGVFDLRGAHIATLVGDEREAGAHTETWNGRDQAGRAVSSGVYFARVVHPSGTKSYKLVLLK